MIVTLHLPPRYYVFLIYLKGPQNLDRSSQHFRCLVPFQSHRRRGEQKTRLSNPTHRMAAAWISKDYLAEFMPHNPFAAHILESAQHELDRFAAVSKKHGVGVCIQWVDALIYKREMNTSTDL